MSIESSVRDALELLQRGRFDSAMSLACAALDATSKNESVGGTLGVGERWRTFVNANLDIITRIAFGGALLAVPGAKLNLIDPENPGSTTSIENIIYKSIRCNLLHEASLPGTAAFTTESFYGTKDGAVFVPTLLILAILLAVVVAKSNSSRTMDSSIEVELFGRMLQVNEFWGKPEAIRAALGV